VLRQPIGVVAAFSPWNFPMSSPARKVGGALSSRLLHHPEGLGGDARGAVQLVQRSRCGSAAGRAQSRVRAAGGHLRIFDPHKTVRLITFTRLDSGRQEACAMAGQHMKPAIMELAGMRRSLSAMTSTHDNRRHVGHGKTRNAGQVCVSPTRFFVQEAIYKDFTNAFAKRPRR